MVMKIGFSSLVGVEPMPFRDLVAWAGANDIDTIEVNVGSGYAPIAGAAFGGHLDLADIVTNGPGDLPELLATHDIALSALAPMVNLLTADLGKREKRIAEFRLAMDAAVTLGVDTIVTFTGSAYGMHFHGLPGVGAGHATNHVADNLRIFREVYGPLADEAEQKGLRIAFETAGRGGGEGNLAHSPALWAEMFAAVPSTALGLSFDPSHLIWLHIPNIPGIVREFGDRIYHVDGKDTEILPEILAREGILSNAWWRYRLPGLGAVNWKDLFSALRDIGYDGTVAIENEDPLCPGTPGVKWAADYLRGCLLPGGITTPAPI